MICYLLNMKFVKIIVLILSLLLILGSCNNNQEEPNDITTDIEDSVNISIIKQARILCFYNDNEYSKHILPVMDSIEHFQRKYVTIEIINIDSFPQFIDSFNIKFAPHVIIYDTIGNIVYNRANYEPYNKFVKLLKGKIF